MGFDSSGIYTRLRGNSSWVGDRDAGTKIEAGLHDNHDNDIANALSECLTKTGKSLPTVDMPWNGKKITNLGAPSNPTDAATKQYVDALKLFPNGIALTGAGSGTPPPSTLGWTNTAIDLSWVGRGTGYLIAGSSPHIALNNKGDGTGTDVFRINEAGSIVMNADWTIASYKTDDWSKIKTKVEVRPGTIGSNCLFTVGLYDNVGTAFGSATFAPGINYGFADGICMQLNGLGGDAGNGGSSIALNKPTDAAAAGVMITQAGLKRWYTYTSGANGDLIFQRYSNAGAYVDAPLVLSRLNYNSIASEARFQAVITALNCCQVFDTDATLNTNGVGTVNYTQFKGPGYNAGLVTRNIVGGTANHHQIFYYNTQIGSITTNGSTTQYNTTSDSRTKANARAATGADARSLVDNIDVIVFDPVEPIDLPEGHRSARDIDAIEGVAPPDNIVFMGISAQQAYGVYPQAVTPPDTKMAGYNPDAKFGDEGFRPWMLDYSKFVPMILANTQDNNSRLDALEARLAQLEAA